jgi:ppGpp synthetase/RelA/SpoT-type nucleotidyltranferase
MARAQEVLREQGIRSTARLKTTNTIIEKLRRERTRLAEMQDIAGLRLVPVKTRERQDALVRRVAASFSGARVIDRRASPKHGYRAVHVVAPVAGFLVEVQIRTFLQDMWAQVVERFADIFGRGLRYGDVPEALAPVLETLERVSDTIADTETLEQEARHNNRALARVARSLDRLMGPETPKEAKDLYRRRIAEIQETAKKQRESARKQRAQLRAMLVNLASVAAEARR